MNSRNNTIEILQKQYKNIKGDQKSKVADILKLYKDGHIFNKATAQKEINNYLSYAKNPLERELRFYKTMTKYLSSDSSTKEKKQTKQFKKNEDKIKNIETKYKIKIIKQKERNYLKLKTNIWLRFYYFQIVHILQAKNQHRENLIVHII